MSPPASNPLPEPIADFFTANHVLSLATVSGGMPWSASCFYAFDAQSSALVMLSSEKTRHGQAMLEHACVAGTIAGQPTSVLQIRGIQFFAEACRLEDDEKDAAFDFYCLRHPIGRVMRGSVWRLALLEVKFTDNSRIFGNKTLWRRYDAEE